MSAPLVWQFANMWVRMILLSTTHNSLVSSVFKNARDINQIIGSHSVSVFKLIGFYFRNDLKIHYNNMIAVQYYNTQISILRNISKYVVC